mmetsp:Transcript_15632/g.39792  ORF Transcript_15632/g.39792 Transcript_15632/m.39792 type:complete len:85 (+) Transcript_15632:673-927(+)
MPGSGAEDFVTSALVTADKPAPPLLRALGGLARRSPALGALLEAFGALAWQLLGVRLLPAGLLGRLAMASEARAAAREAQRGGC